MDADDLLKAIFHPLRKQIMLAFDDGETSPRQLAERFEADLPQVCYHVGVLRDIGVIELSRRTQRRGAVEHHYRPKIGLRTMELDGRSRAELLDELARMFDGVDCDAVGAIFIGVPHKQS